MSGYMPGPAHTVEVRKDGDKWTMILVRELRQPPEKVWQAITDPAELHEWAPFDAEENMGRAGAKVKLTTVGMASPFTTTVTRADAPEVLEYDWMGNLMRWELKPSGEGTRLTLWASIDKRYISMGASGWHICFDVLERMLDGAPIGRMAGPATMSFAGWQKLNGEYAKQFGVEVPSWGAKG